MPDYIFQIGDRVIYNVNSLYWGEGVIRTIEDDGWLGVEFENLRGRGYNLNGGINNNNGQFVCPEDLELIKPLLKPAHKKCQGLIVCRSCRKKEMEF